MYRSPYADEGGIPRRFIVIAVIVLAAAALVMLAGPSNVLGLLHLKDLETAPNVVPIIPQSKPMITPEELRSYVVGSKRPDPVRLGDYAQVAGMQGNVIIVPVQGGFELEFLLDNGGVVSAILTENATGSRLSVTTGTAAALYDSFTHLDDKSETSSEAAPFVPPRPVSD